MSDEPYYFEPSDDERSQWPEATEQYVAALEQHRDELEAKLNTRPAPAGDVVELVDALWYTTALIAHGMKMSDVFLINGKQRTVEEVWLEGKAAPSPTLTREGSELWLDTHTGI